jgi:hypothetical protein
MGDVKIALVDIPDDRCDDLLAALDGSTDEPEESPPGPPAPAVEWDEDRAAAAIEALGDTEIRLLWRVADARGARVPLGELVRDFGLPGDAALERDFSGLSAYCADPQSRPALPVASGGGEEAWYWMDPALGALFREAIERKVFPQSTPEAEPPMTQA